MTSTDLIPGEISSTTPEQCSRFAVSSTSAVSLSFFWVLSLSCTVFY